MDRARKHSPAPHAPTPLGSPAFSRRLLDNIPDIAWLKDAEGRYLAVNEAYLSLYQLTEDSVLGHTDFDLMSEKVAAHYESQDREVMKHGQQLTIEDYYLEERNGWFETIWLEIELTPIYDDRSHCIGISGLGRDVSSRKRLEAVNKEQQERLSAYFEQPLIGMATVMPYGGWLDANEKICEILGVNHAELIDTNWLDHVQAEDRERCSQAFADMHKGHIQEMELDLRLLTAEGDRWGHLMARPMLKADRSVDYILMMLQDVTEVKHAVDELKLAGKVFDHASEAILITDSKNRIMRINAAFTRHTGYTADEVIGKDPKILSSGKHDKAFFANMWQQIHETGQWSGEIWDRRKDGSLYPKWMTINAIPGSRSAEVAYFVAVFADISERKEAESRIRHLAYYNPLTDLPNRVFVNEKIAHAMKLEASQEDGLFLMVVNIDRFHTINDSMGHLTGDELLKAVGNRLRDMFPHEHCVAHLGGDEFAVLLQARKGEATGDYANQIVEKMREPLDVMDFTMHITASVGVSVYPRDAGDASRMLESAYMAMHHVKNAGGNAASFFSRQMHQVAQMRIKTEYNLRLALERNEFELFFQPQVNPFNKQVIGAESLIRWRHPKNGLISPATFIPIAEESGLILRIGDWVLRAACEQLAAWNRDNLSPISLAVNLSARQFEQADLITKLEKAIGDYNIDPRWLDIEITEGVLMNRPDVAKRILQNMQDMGCRVSIDDFGTGYSSLSYLTAFPIDKLKIDQSFVRDIDSNRGNAAIAKAILALSHSMGLKVVAEGVESEAQLDYLMYNDCDIIQGYYFSKPLPNPEFVNYLHTSEARFNAARNAEDILMQAAYSHTGADI